MYIYNRFAQAGISTIYRTSASQLYNGLKIKTSYLSNPVWSPCSSFPIPVKVFDVNRGSASSLLHFTNSRCYSEDVKEKRKEAHVSTLAKPKRLNNDEPRWFHPSPTEKLENPAYTYLKNHPEYQTMFFQQEVYARLMTEDGQLTPEGEETVNPAVKAFIELCNDEPDEYITDPKYEGVFTDLISQCSNLTDIELLLVFYTLQRFPKRPRAKDKDYRKIWQPLDDLCCHRLSERLWNLEYMFNVADLMYSAGLSTESKFHWELVKRLYRRVDHLSKEEFIRMMFCFGGVKSLPDSLSIYNVEYNLPKFIDSLTPEEVSVVSVGFLRTKTKVNNKDVMKKMLKIVADEAVRIASPSISAVAKAITLSSTYTLEDDVYQFLDAFVSEVSRIDVHACASLVLLGMKAKVVHEQLLREIVRKLTGNVNIMRSKDLEYICDGLTTFGIDCDDFYKEIVEDLQTRVMNMPIQSFCNAHGRSFVNILHYLSQQNIYPQDLITIALSDDFLDRTFGRSMYTYPQEVLLLDICTGLEAEEYSGPRLSEKYRGFLTKKNMLWIAAEEKVSSSDYQRIARFMHDVCVNALGGPEFCHLCNVVPPFRTIGAVYCVDANNETALPVPEDFVAIDDFNIKYIPQSSIDNNVKFHAFVLFPGNQVAANTGQPVGLAEMHCRQMSKMGFEVHPIYVGRTVTGPVEMKKVICEVLNRPIPDEPKIE